MGLLKSIYNKLNDEYKDHLDDKESYKNLKGKAVGRCCLNCFYFHLNNYNYSVGVCCNNDVEHHDSAIMGVEEAATTCCRAFR